MGFSAMTMVKMTGQRLAVGLQIGPPETQMAFDSLLPFARTQEFTLSRRSETTSSAVVLDGRTGDAYNEQVFRHFLHLERERASAGGRNCLLVLVSLRPHPNRHTREMSRHVGSAVLTGVGECVREVDFIGWYRERQVAGAVLTQGLDSPTYRVGEVIADRVRHALGRRLPASVASRLRVRVIPLGKATNR
jgi:hypothetical protein